MSNTIQIETNTDYPKFFNNHEHESELKRLWRENLNFRLKAIEAQKIPAFRKTLAYEWVRS